jgi:uncharacterized protein (DUF305 family)
MHGALQMICVRAMFVASLLFLVGTLFLCAHVQAETHMHGNRLTDDADWSELISSMDKMHMAMNAVVRSGNSDIDFVRLMLPHHQAAVDMAKTQLLYGKDPQLRRLAQEIIIDQQLEIELMQHWLQQHHAN